MCFYFDYLRILKEKEVWTLLFEMPIVLLSDTLLIGGLLSKNL